MRSREDSLKRGPGILNYVLVAIILVWTIFPIYWMAQTSIKPMGEWLAFPPVWMTSQPTAGNFVTIITGAALGGFTGTLTSATKAIIDSAIVASAGTAMSIVIGMLAAFGLSRHIKGMFVPMLILSARMAPPVVIMIPLVILYSTIQFVDTYQGLILAYALFTIPYSSWMIRSFIDDVPRDLEDAAKIEGLTTLGAHFKVTLPLIKGGIAATALFVLILNWSEFLLALTMTHGKVMTIPVQTNNYFAGTAGVLYGPQSALGIVAIIPLIVFGYVIRKHLARGLTFGAVKR